MLELAIHFVLSCIPFWAWVRAMNSRDDMKIQRDAAVAEASRYRSQAKSAYKASLEANKRADEADSRAEFLAYSPPQPASDSRAVRTLQAELAAARKVLSENNLLVETHKGGRA